MMHIRVGGVWHNMIAPWGDWSYSTDEHGCAQASWSAYFAPGIRHPALHRGALVEVMRGPWVVWSGFLDELDWDTGTFHAKGFSFAAENFLALDGSGNSTATPSTAVDQAIVRGWPVTRGAGIPTTAFTATADGANTVGSLLQANSDELGQRWTVRADRAVRMATDATTPTLMIRQGVVSLGNASDDYASAVVVVYQDTGGTYEKVIREDEKASNKFGYKEVPLDLTDLGAMTQARAEGFGDAELARGRSRLGWTSTVEVTADELRTIGDVPADLAMVESGQMVRIFAGYDDLQYLDGLTYLDVVLGPTGYAGGDTISIGPLGKVVETRAEVYADLYEKAAS